MQEPCGRFPKCPKIRGEGDHICMEGLDKERLFVWVAFGCTLTSISRWRWDSLAFLVARVS